MVSLLELSAHISYLMAVRDGEGQDGAALAVKGPVESVHRLTQADLDIRFSCQRLKRSRVNDLQPHLLVREKPSASALNPPDYVQLKEFQRKDLDFFHTLFSPGWGWLSLWRLLRGSGV